LECLFIHRDETEERKVTLTNAVFKILFLEKGWKYENLPGAPRLFKASGQEVRKSQIHELKVFTRLINN
jgi:hypothetical protein